jgi:hypothetical protein
MASQPTLSASSSNELGTAMQPPNIPLSEIGYRNRDWVLIDHPTQRKGSRQSKAWYFGDHYIAIDDPDQNTWRCRPYSDGDLMIILHKTTISPVLRHPRKKHHIPLEYESSDVTSTTTDWL